MKIHSPIKSTIKGSFLILVVAVVMTGLMPLIIRHSILQAEQNQQLLSAVRHHDVEAARLSLSRGADINAQDSPHSRLSFWEALKQIFAFNQKPKVVYPSALIIAVEQDNAEMATLLLEKGADVEQKDSQGRTALRMAAGTGKIQMADLLITHKAQVNSADHNGMTVLMAAAEDESPQMLTLLCSAGADVNARDNTGKTVLMVAVGRNSPEPDAVAVLLARGADAAVKDKHGNTALTLVQGHSRGTPEGKIIPMLERAARK
jgi:ankyrin repeat protein